PGWWVAARHDVRAVGPRGRRGRRAPPLRRRPQAVARLPHGRPLPRRDRLVRLDGGGAAAARPPAAGVGRRRLGRRRRPRPRRLRRARRHDAAGRLRRGPHAPRVAPDRGARAPERAARPAAAAGRDGAEPGRRRRPPPRRRAPAPLRHPHVHPRRAVHPRRGRARPATAWRWDVKPGFRVPLTSVIGRAYRTGEPQYVPDTSRDAEFVVAPGAEPTRSELALPVKVGDEVRAVINLEHTEPDAFTSDDHDTLRAFTRIVVEV